MAIGLKNQASEYGGGGDGRRISIPTSTGTVKKVPLLSEKKAAQATIQKQTQQNAGEANASPKAAQKAAYYSRPQLGGFEEKLYNKAVEAETKLKDKYDAYNTAFSQVEKAKADVENWGQQVAQIRETNQKNPSQMNGEYLKRAQNYMMQLLSAYEEKKTAFDSVAAGYEPERAAYEKAVGEYNNYIQNVQGQLDAWKGTIRDMDTIRGDMTALDEQIKKTEEQIGSLKTLTRFRNDAFGDYMKQSLQESQTRLEALQSQRALLQEEYDWSKLSTMGDIDGATEFGKLSADDRLMMLDMVELQNWSQEDRAMLERYIRESDAEFWGNKGDLMPTMNNAVTNANELFAKYGEDKVREMAESLRRYQNTQTAELMMQKAEAGANGKLPGLHSALSVGANLLNSISSPMGYMQEIGNGTGRYGSLDTNNVGNLLGKYAGTVRSERAKALENSPWAQHMAAGAAAAQQYMQTGTVADGLAERLEEGDGKLAGTLYTAGMSAADNLARILLSGGSKFASLGLAATGSFGSTVNQMSAQGASPGQAIAMGLIDGALEVVTEKFSLDNLLDMAASGKKDFANVVMDILKQGAVEVSEEETGFLLSTLAEAAIMREKSSYNLRLKELTDSGMTVEEARQIANAELWKEAGQTAAQSFLSGGMMAGATSAYSGVVNKQIEKIEQKATKSKESMVLSEGEVEGLSLPQVGVRVETTDRVKQAVIEQAGRLAKATGREIVFYSADATENGIENGYYQDGTIYINTRSDDAFGQIVGHELTHSAEFADVYQDLSKTVFRLLEGKGINLQSLQQQKADLYAENGHALKDTAEVNKEIVADFVGQYLLSDEQTILDVVKQNRTLGQRIVSWFDGLLAKLGNSKAQERVMLTNARELWAKALTQTKNSPAATLATPDQQTRQVTAQTASNTEKTDGGDIDWQNPEAIRKFGDELFSRGEINEEEHAWYMDMADQAEIESDASFSYAGKNARNANFQTLGTAQELERMGVANETIRQQTGWFKGMDGKWRFEVDDSGIRYDSTGDFRGAENTGEDYINKKRVSQVLDDNAPSPDVRNVPAYTLDKSVADESDSVKQFSISAVDKRGIAGDLRSILNRGGSVSELRQYIENLERGGGSAERTGGNAYQTGSFAERNEIRRIIQEAKLKGVGVEEYLRQNWEQYEVDGQWNAAARAALDQEQQGRRYSISSKEIQQIQSIGRISVNQFSDSDIQATERFAQQYWNEMGVKSPFFRAWFGDWRANDKAPIQIANQPGNTRGVQQNDDTGWEIQVSGKVFAESDHKAKKNQGALPYLSYINDIVQKAVLLDSVGIDQSKAKSNNSLLMHSMYAVADIGNGPELLKLYVEEMNDPNRDDTAKRAYQLQNIEKQQLGVRGSGVNPSLITPTATIKNVADLFDVVKQHDPDFSPNPASKAVNADGTPKIYYHGTNAEWNTYDLSKNVNQMWGNGIYLAETAERARLYGDNVMPLYVRALYNNRDAKKYGVSRDHTMMKNGDILVFSPEQIKSATQNQGTFNKYNPDIRYSISGTGDETSEKKSGQQIREEMPAKARNYLEGKERLLLTKMGEKLGVSKFQNRESLQELIREISDEFLVSGRIPDEKMDFLFDKGFAEGIIEDARFYNEYKDIKDHLRTVGVTLSQQDQADIADYNDFRRRAFGTVRIVKDGMPVDSAYHELHEMAPELFPESITHPADQLVRMYEVGRSIQVAEVSLQHHYGPEADIYRKAGKQDFADTVNTHIAELRTVKKVAEEAAMKAAEKALTPTTPEEAAEAYKQLKDARRTYEKAVAKNLLSDSDEIQVGRLLKGEILPEHLDPDKDNIRAITAVYEAKQEYERLTKLIAAYKTSVREERQQKADDLLETANEWKDKKVGLAYSRETMERNIYDIVPDKAVAERVNQEIFHPIHMAEAEATRFKNEYREQVRALQLSRKPKKGNLVSEAHAVQLLGEAEDNIRVLQNSKGRMKQRDGKTLEEWKAVIDEMWRQSPDLNEQKIRNAVAAFRKIYDGLFQQMNEVRIRNGYEPVNYRQGYFPHFQPGDGDSVMIHFGKVLGIDTQVAALPTSINGMTHAFRPGIQWFGNAQERLGFNTAYDAVEGFDKYIEGVASVIHQTDNIQMLRAMESRIRYRTTDEGIRKQVDAVNADNRLTEEEKRVKINDIFEHGKYTLSNFVTELTEYTNLLANKKSRLDRTTEALIGRRAYTIMKNWESRVGANMIAGNISSALTNFIPLTQAGAQLDTGSMLKGMWDTLKSYKEDDGFAGMSTFLTNRRGSDPLVQTWAQKASEKMKLNMLMDLVDGFTSDTIVRATYNNNLKHGLSEAEAMYQADLFASNVMADRSKGAMPTLFESTNPIFKMFTQFQLEVNNQYSEVFKDLPRRHKEKGLLVMTGILLKYFIGAYLFNDLYEYFTGRRPALDPFGMLNDTVGDWTGYDLPNVVDWISGKDTDFTAEKVGVGEAMKNLASSALGELPFSSGLTLLGIETDGGRVPASSAIPDLTALWDAATQEGWSAEKRWKEAQDELMKLAYIVPPFGGNQVQKIWKGVKAYREGGSYNVDAEGKDILQYPVYNDEAGDFWSLVRAMIMGKSSLETAQDWVDSGFDSLSTNQTAVYQDMVAAGATQRESYALIRELQEVKKTETQSEAELKRDVLQSSDLPGDAKAVAYYGLFASDTEQELMDTLSDMGADPGETAKVLMEIADAGLLKGAAASNTKRDAIAKADLTDQEKQVLYREKVSDSRDDEIAQLRAVGIDFDEFLDIHSKYTTINEKDMKAGEKATEFSYWLDGQGYTEKQKAVVKDEFAFFTMTPADAKKYDELVDSGLDPEEAYELAGSLTALEPEEGEEQVTNVQRWRECVNFSSNVAVQLAALRGVADDSQYTKIQIAYDFDVMPDSYVSLQEVKAQYDADGNGSFTNQEMKAAVDSLPGNLSKEQKAVLWQLATGNKSAKNNPYSRDVGQAVIDAREAAKAQK